MPTLRGLSRVSLRPESARQLSDERLFTLLANRLRGLGLCVAKRSLCGVVMVLALLSLSSQVRAQAFPSKPIRLVLPYPAGGGIDLVARPLAEKLTEIFGQSVVVDNRGGASGLLAMQQVASAAPMPEARWPARPRWPCSTSSRKTICCRAAATSACV